MPDNEPFLPMTEEDRIRSLLQWVGELEVEVIELKNKNAVLEARLKVLENRLGVNVHNPCSTG